MQSLPRSIFIFAFCVPLALVFGVLLATPLDRTSMGALAIGFFLLLIPILLSNHHGFLIFSIYAYINIYFLPGQPQLWLIATVLSLFFAILTRTLNRGKIEHFGVTSITWSLILLFVVSFVTAYSTGGVGVRALGSGNYGGRKYVYLWGAILAYFLISAFPVPEKKRQFYAGLYIIAGVTSVISNLAYTLGPDFYFLFLLFPSEFAVMQAIGDDMQRITRISGLGPASIALVSFIILRYGFEGTLNLKKPLRVISLVLALTLGLFSGFRSALVFPLLLMGCYFFAEKLYKTKYMPLLIISCILVGSFLIPFAERLPLSIQRCLTIFPLDLDPSAIADARGSSEWRIQIWRSISADIPKYFWLGKGFSIDPKDLFFAQLGTMETSSQFENAIVAGDYHNGPLTLIMPFGIWGVLCFLWFTVASIKVLWLNWKNSAPEVLNVNKFFFLYFIAKLIFFIFIFGAFYVDILFFTTLVALSLSINRGVLRVPYEQRVKASEPAQDEPLTLPEGQLQPA
jgi:hypothetical protein